MDTDALVAQPTDAHSHVAIESTTGNAAAVSAAPPVPAPAAAAAAPCGDAIIVPPLEPDVGGDAEAAVADARDDLHAAHTAGDSAGEESTVGVVSVGHADGSMGVEVSAPVDVDPGVSADDDSASSAAATANNDNVNQDSAAWPAPVPAPPPLCETGTALPAPVPAPPPLCETGTALPAPVPAPPAVCAMDDSGAGPAQAPTSPLRHAGRRGDDDDDLPVEEISDGRRSELLEKLSVVSRLPIARLFRHTVDFEELPDYLLQVAYPVSLKMIKFRLENSFYRREAALLWDIAQLGKNALIYNGEDAAITKDAQSIVTAMQRYVLNGVDPLPRLGREYGADLDPDSGEESDREEVR
jgi:hypothetical protein